MSLTETFIVRLEALESGERARLRQLAGQPLDHTLPGFDLFTGLWWPLRQKSPRAPERRSAWLVAKLYGSVPVPHGPDSPSLATALARCEPRDEFGRQRFRGRFDALLQSPLSRLEAHLRWALLVVNKAVARRQELGINWVYLLDDLRLWDRGTGTPDSEPVENESSADDKHSDARGTKTRLRRDIRDIWAEEYLNATTRVQGANPC